MVQDHHLKSSEFQDTVVPSPAVIHHPTRASLTTTTYNEPSSKSVVNDIMVKHVEAMRLKNIPFSFLDGDLPTYKMITQLKAENPELFKDIIPILIAFHQLMSYYIYAIYKRFKGSGMADTG